MTYFAIFEIHHLNHIAEADRKFSKPVNIMFTTIRFIDNLVTQSETEREKFNIRNKLVLDGSERWYCHYWSILR